MKLNLSSQLAKLKLLFFHPAKFFKTILNEKDYLPILLFFVIIYMISKIIGIIAFLPITLKFLELIPKDIEVSSSLFITNLVVSYISNFIYTAALAFASPFIGSAIAHLGVLIVKGKNGFINTFKPITYAMVIGVIYSTLLVIIVAVTLIIKPVDLNIFTSIESPSLIWQSILPYLIILIPAVVIIGLVSFIHILYAEITGIAFFQKISKWRAFLAAFIIPIALLILVIIIIGILILVPFLILASLK